jgi:hypothetical protein
MFRVRFRKCALRKHFVLLLDFPEKRLLSVTLLEYSNEHVNLRQESSAVLLNFRKKLFFNNHLLLGA